jgi:hypothetical protein
VFCDDITETGLLDMLRVVKLDLKGSVIKQIVTMMKTTLVLVLKMMMTL